MKKTVLVLGAGASVDFDLPTGDSLSRQIEQILTFRVTADNNLTGHQALLRELQNSPNSVKFFPAAERVAQALPYSSSIDDVLFKFGDDPLMIKAGKAAIVAAILQAEKNSWLRQTGGAYPNTVATLRSRSNVWLFHFLKFVQSNTPATMPAAAFEGLSIINFNYDRCLEHYLVQALQPAFAIDAGRAADIVSGLRIIHPYGTVGPLPWQQASTPKVEFGRDPDRVKLLDIADNIRTFTEQQEDGDQAAEARRLVFESQQIIFLGFGFHGQNMNLIGPRKREYTSQIFGTVFGASGADREVFGARVSACLFGGEFSVNPRFEPETCADFINHFGLLMFR